MEIRGTGTARQFSPDEEAALRQDASTASLMKGKTQVEVRGDDRTYRAEKAYQQSAGHAGNVFNAAELAGKGLDGAAIVGMHLPHCAAALSLEIASPIVALAVGAREIVEAHENGAKRAEAAAKDTAHVALLGALDLPEAYKAVRIQVDFAGVSRGFGSTAFKMTEAIAADRKAMTVLQLHADQGMRAARDVLQSGGDPARFAGRCASDAAFKEGFDAYRFVAQNARPDERKTLDAQLDTRDGWYAQAQVQMRT